MTARSAEAAGSDPPDRVEIRAPARVHVTPTGVRVPAGRLAGVGFAVDSPRLHLVLRRADVLRCEGADGPRAARRFEQEVVRAATLLGCDTAVEARLLSGIPAHRGLGSDIRLRLSVLRGLAELNGTRLTRRELATLADAGGPAGSGHGLGAFLRGGLLVDGERSVGIPPAHWGLVLAVPEPSDGPDGREPAMVGVPVPVADAQAVRHLLLRGLLPALHDADLEAFGTCLTALQDVGRRRAPRRWTELRHWRLLVDLMCAEGAAGGGLSPSGPMVYGVYDRRRHDAHELAARIESAAGRAGLRLRSLATTVFGGPATVETSRGGGSRPAAGAGQERAEPGPVR